MNNKKNRIKKERKGKKKNSFFDVVGDGNAVLFTLMRLVVKKKKEVSVSNETDNSEIETYVRVMPKNRHTYIYIYIYIRERDTKKG